MIYTPKAHYNPESDRDTAIKNTLKEWRRIGSTYVSKSTSKDAYLVLKWLRGDIDYWDHKKEKVSEDLVELVVILVHHAYCQPCFRRRITRRRSKAGDLFLLFNFLEGSDEEHDYHWKQFMKELQKLSNGLLVFRLLMDFFHSPGQWTQWSAESAPSILPNKEVVLNWFINSTLLFKHKEPPTVHILDSAKMLSYFVTKENFKTLLLPAIQKALLRSPETTLGIVGSVLKSIDFYLDDFALELAGFVIAVLRSQSEESKPDAILLTATIARKISSHSKMKGVLEAYFGTFCGAEGKLTTSVSKINFLKAIKGIEIWSREVPDLDANDVENISTYVCEKCVTVLESEVHDGTIIACFEVLRAWVTAIPASLQKYISKTFKSIKAPLRFHFFTFLTSVSYSRLHGIGILPEIHKWLAQPISTAPATFTIESLPLLSVVLRREGEDKIAEDMISIAKALLTDIVSKKTECCRLSSRYLLDVVLGLVQARLNSNKLDNVIFYAIVPIVTQNNYQVRKELMSTFKQFLAELCPDDVLTGLMPSLLTHSKSKSGSISGHAIREVISAIVDVYSKSWSTLDLQRLAIEMIYLAHTCQQERYWLTILRYLRLSPKEVVKAHWTLLNERYIVNFSNDLITAKIVRTCVAVGGTAVSGDIVKEYFKVFNSDSLINLTQEEFMIFKSKSDEPCDQDGKASNTKVSLKSEADDKYKRPGGKPDLVAQKKKEMLKAQLEKESAIREQVKCIEVQVIRVAPLFEIALEENIYAFGPFMPEIVKSLLDTVSNPLASSYAINIFNKIGVNVMEESLGSLVSHISVKLNILVDDSSSKNAKKEDVECMKTALKLIKKAIEANFFSCSAFAYSFPFFKLAVQRCSQESGVLLQVLECIIIFLKRLTSHEFYASPVPRVEVCKLLYSGFANPSKLIQQKCLSGLLELSKSSHIPLAAKSRTQEIQEHTNALFSDSSSLRDAGIRSLAIIVQDVSSLSAEDLALLKASIYRTKFDEETEIKNLADEIWAATTLEINASVTQELLENVSRVNECVRRSASKAMVSIVQTDSDQVEAVLQQLLATYNEHFDVIPAVVDNLGRIIEPALDRWEARHGVGYAIKLLTPHLPRSAVKSTLDWTMEVGLVDRNVNVHNICLDAAVEIVNIHGKEFLTEFVTLVESYLDGPKRAENDDSFQEACVILMGCLASHLDPSDLRIKKIFTTLVATLSTPSEKVQEAVANCIPGLVPSLGSEAIDAMNTLLNNVMESNTYGGRRGAAYGLAGLVKGMGILSLKQNNIMNILGEGLQEKKNYKRKEGCLMALELLCASLGRLFEPYIVHVLPHLLQCLGDPNTYVREATENTAKCLMSRLSGHGVKLVLPALLNALNEDSWRTKCGSVDLLGRMAFCAPKQLSGCLPMIVPHLIEVLSDSHVKVQEASTKALGLIGSVIRNPEIQTVVPTLLEALSDPSKKTHKCMQILLKTEFVHFVDPPSLALIMPVVQRAFQDRSTETRRMASQIIGNMYSLTDHSDLIPYMSSVMPGLKTSLTDPVPEVRGVAAKALGSMAKGLGEKCYDEILPWLMKTLVSETSSVDRSGAAQGLAEVIGALGDDKLQRFMPEIIRKADSDDIAPHVRDGYMMMFIYMPSVFEEDFIPYIGQILNPILKALADENEFVRDTALRAGQRIVAGYADTAITLLLPELEKGIFDDNWRIRFSSVQLLGDLLYKISGVSGKMSTESSGDDDNFGTEQSQNVITETLGQERRNRVLAGLYIERSDVALMVRQAALHVWKVVVANTPKTLREILKTLFSLLLNCLASPSHDKRQVAARTLGDLVRKLGEKILPEILPLLERGLESSVAAERQGVCVGLAEIMTSTSREMVLVFVDNLVPTLRKGLCDSDPDVRTTAAQTFGSLHATIGTRALDEVIPFMLKKIDDPDDGDNALYGLGQLVLVRSKNVMPYVIPHLLSPPVNLKALAILSSVSGEAMSKHLQKILPALLNLLKTTSDQEQTVKSCGQVLLSITDEDGVRSLINELLGFCNVDQADKVPGILLLSIFCSQTKADLTPYIPELIKCFILQMVIEDAAVLKYVVEALTIIIKNIDPTDQPGYVGVLHQALRFAKADLKGTEYLPGLCAPKGINSVLPVLREALLNGPAEIKEATANGMHELITLTSPDALKPAVIHITGPLIRILGDRYGPNIKVAVIETLTLLLKRVGIHLKAFLPQLQTTFLKGSVDPNRNVRLEASSALAELVKIHPKPDPLFLELSNAIKTTEDTGVRDTALATLRSILSLGADKMNEVTKKTISPVLTQHLNSSDKAVRAAAEDCLRFIM